MNRVSRRLHGWKKRSGIWVKILAHKEATKRAAYEPVKVHWVIKK